MTKLPINLLLYVAILGFGAADGLQFWEAYQEKDNRLDQQANREQFERRLEDGKNTAGRASERTPYGVPKEAWESFKTANFWGEVPVEPVPGGPGAQLTEPVEPVIPEVSLEDIFAVVCMVFDGENSRVILRYKPSANVQPPDDVLADLGTGGFPRAGMDTAPARPGVPVGRAGALPSFGDGLGAAQHLMIDDTLWNPYEHIRLVRVSEDARFAVFRVEKPGTPKEEWREESMYPEALQLPQAVLRQLEEGLGVAVLPTERADEPASAPAQPSGWSEMPDTREVSRNRFNVGTRDRDRFRTDPNRIFNEDIGTASYTSRDRRVQGVRITRIAPGYESYGVQQGEVIVAINGEPVRSKAEAIKVGKRLYEQGVRTFSVQFLRNGQPITRTYVAPDE